ncbi:MAG: hypothetical protein L6R42_005131 [Xanthoria sp. 1 TBL-2021]|nr:MAG: hypothetical protein L6R42_005131 [Xanthoria sp. 1 TBL-2021]
MAYRQQKERPSRLKPPCIDPLDSVGLVSKGDQSLLNHETQEDYFNTITTRYHALVGPSEGQAQDEDGVTARLAFLSLNQDTLLAAQLRASSPGMPPIIMAMRKLREAIVASSRVDEFAKTVYIFIIRTTILLGHPESYHPALLHLIRRIHCTGSLSKEEETEFIGYYILDLACRQHDLANAFGVRNMYDHRSGRIDTVLMALVHGNWVLFEKAKGAGNTYEKRLMEWAGGRMTDRAVQCLGKTYLSVSKAYVEQCTGMTWESLKESRNLLWTCEGQTVMIK